MKEIDIREFTTPIAVRTNIMEQYLEDIRKYPVLTINEEIDLFYKIKEGDEEARKKIINCNQRFVFAIAKRYCTTDKVMDLVNEGNIGLIDAIDRYDVTKGIRFLSYAVWYIRRSIVYYLMNDNLIVRKSNNAKCNGKVNAIKNKYFCENGCFPTDDEIIDLMKKEFDIDITNKADIYELRTNSINDTYDNDDDRTVEESPEFTNKTHSKNEYEETTESDYYKIIIQGMIKKLEGREKRIIELSYGINCDKEYSNYEIGQIMGMSGERARQIKNIALDKLRQFQVEKFC